MKPEYKQMEKMAKLQTQPDELLGEDNAIRLIENILEEDHQRRERLTTKSETDPTVVHLRIVEEADDEEVMALFDEIEPYYSRTNQILANL
jgi:hypothetical protein